MKKILFTVTNDLSYDQRMIRICGSLARAGYRVTLVGRKLRDSIPLQAQAFRQKRIHCFFRKGKAFYAEFNIRLFFYLLFKRMSLVCAIDLDTILPVYYVSRLRGVQRIYDAHELFCEMKEIVSRPGIYKKWKKIERRTVPNFKYGYTVNQPIADEFKKMYGVDYEVIRNMPLMRSSALPEKTEKYVLYQGAVNEGRCFEFLIPAMKEVNAKLLIVGDGNFMEKARSLVRENELDKKIIFKGKILPGELSEITLGAWVGVTLFDNKGLSNYLSLANRFFDYVAAGIPQICMNYPVYAELNKSYPVAVLLNEPTVSSISAALNELFTNAELYGELQNGCLLARKEWNWEKEEVKLLEFYKKLSD